MMNMRGCLKKSWRQKGRKERSQVRWDKRDDPGECGLRIFLVDGAMTMLRLEVTA